VSEQPADSLPGREEISQFVVKSNQELCVCVCRYECFMDQTDRHPDGPRIYFHVVPVLQACRSRRTQYSDVRVDPVIAREVHRSLDHSASIAVEMMQKKSIAVHFSAFT